MIKKVKSLQKSLTLLLTGGLDEASPVNQQDLNGAITMTNFRLSRDGKRIKKKLGTALQNDFGANALYGYHSYKDSGSNHCQLVAESTALFRKISTGGWTNIHSWSSSISAPVNFLEIQGKQFCINNTNSRMIHTNDVDYQIGITAPTTLASAVATYQGTLPLSEDCAVITDWTDDDSGGVSSQTGSNPAAGQGPDGAQYFYFTDDGTPAAGEYAQRSLVSVISGGIDDIYTFEALIDFEAIGSTPDDYLQIFIHNKSTIVELMFSSNGVWAKGGSAWYNSLKVGLDLSAWQRWKFTVDSAAGSADTISVTCNMAKWNGVSYEDDELMGSVLIDNNTTGLTNGDVIIKQKTGATSDVYFNHIYITDESTMSGNLNGRFRYAITYGRSGNFSCESNPIKSKVGAVAFTGAGLNDCTSGGTYTGSYFITIRVQIDGTGTPDTVKISYDNGDTWTQYTVPVALSMNLMYGVTLSFGATTGHTLNNYWNISCSLCGATPGNQYIGLTSIPVSSDPQVNQRRLYRSTSGGANFYYLTTLEDNTTTTYYDNIPDNQLGSLMEEDHDLAPNGKFACWWDERLWIAGTNIVYHSQPDYPEHFDLSERYMTFRMGDRGNEITGMKVYKEKLFVFMRKQVYEIVKRLDGTYSRKLVLDDIGTDAPYSIIGANNLLMFKSLRGIELFNGEDVYSMDFSVGVKRTFDSITSPSTVTAVHVRKYNEVMFTTGQTTTAIVYNYAYNAFYLFTFNSNISMLNEALDSSNVTQNWICCTNGKLLLNDSGYQDDSTNISAAYRKPWINLGQQSQMHRIEVEYELPATMALTMKCYVNFDKDAVLSRSLAGDTPSATDIELRRIIFDSGDIGIIAKYLSIEFTNAENLGGDLKINSITLWYSPRYLPEDIGPD